MIVRFDDEVLCSILLPTARSETAWRGGIHWRLGLRLGALSWPPRRGPEGVWDSVGWSQNPSVARGFASETQTFAKRGQNWSTSHVPSKTPPRTAKLNGTEGFSGRNGRRNWQGQRLGTVRLAIPWLVKSKSTAAATECNCNRPRKADLGKIFSFSLGSG